MKKKKQGINYILDLKTLSYKKIPTKLELGKSYKCYIYARVSSQGQVDNGNGIDNQISICRMFASKKSMEVVDIFSDLAVSGRESHRKGFDNMMNKLKLANKSGVEIDYVVMSEYSRFSRNQKLGVTEDMEDEIKKTGCHLLFEKGNLSTDNANDVLALDNERIKAKHESLEGAIRTTSRMTGRMLDGYYVLAAPIGYKYKKEAYGLKKTRSFLMKNPDQFDIVKEGLEGYASGVFQSHVQLLDFFNSRLLTTNSRNSKPGHLRLTLIQRMLSIDRLYLYAGYIIYPKFGLLDKVEANHEPMISLGTMYKILEREGARKGYGGKGPKNDRNGTHPLVGLLYCCNCNRPFTSLVGKGNGGTYNYYGCNRKDCPKNYSVRVEEVEKEFLWLLSDTKPKKWLLMTLDKLFENAFDDSNSAFEKSQKHLKLKIKELGGQIESKMLALEKVSTILVMQKLEEDIGRLMQEKNELEDRINDKLMDEQERKKLYYQFKGIMENPVGVWELGNKDIRATLLKVLFGGKLYYNKKNGFKTIQNEHKNASFANILSNQISYGGTDGTGTRDLPRDRRTL